MRNICLLILGFIASSTVNADQSCELLVSNTEPVLSRRVKEEKELERHWRKTGISLQVFNEMKILNPENCKSNPVSAHGCLAMLDALARTGEPSLALIPKSVRLAFKGEIVRVVKDFGPLILAEVDSDLEWRKDMTAMETVQLANLRDLAFRAAVFEDFKSFRKLDYMELLFHISMLVITPERESYQTGAMISAFMELEDSHARLAPAGELDKEEKSYKEEKWAGIGVGVDIRPSGLEISFVAPGSGADAAGLRPGDIIKGVGNLNIKTTKPFDLIDAVEGREGTFVDLKIVRAGRPTLVSVRRATIETHNVEGKLLSHPGRDPVGVIKIQSFLNHNTCREVKREIIRLEASGATGLILDLRMNGGGSMDEAICIAGLFVGKKLVARQVELENGKSTDIISKTARITDLPLVILLNHASASASEFVSGALRDYHRAWIMGEQSFGKASVQVAFDFAVDGIKKGAIIAYSTVARFFQPNGSSNQKVGIPPQFPVPESPGEEIKEHPRELQRAPFTPPGSRTRWHEDRPELVKALRECLESNPKALELYSKLRGEGQNADYRELKALDLLDCMKQNPG